ncbi:MAG: RNA polymerase sigma-70 factor [Bacteroidales bacterium]|nr:MAG: RNA polymerase sigma-70 factor [Bacteroidales bacterium]
MSLRDDNMIKGINRGDKKTFDLAFKSYYPGLCVFAKDFLRSADAAREITQEVFLSLWEKRGKLQIKSSLKAYLYRSVHNRCLNYIRDDLKLSHKEINFDQLKNQADLLFNDVPEGIYDQIFSGRIEQDLETEIEQLPEQCKTIFRLCRYENLTYPEIAKQLNISLSTVKTQMSRAMKKLREKMGRYL